ncbi:hypothetical protein J1614_011108 [Plenodomus biglobosus]|nr:hypothetical protein J1614_011108 [Plenodomus biglobosus]
MYLSAVRIQLDLSCNVATTNSNAPRYSHMPHHKLMLCAISPPFPLPANLTSIVGLCTKVCSTTQYLSVNLPNVSTSSWLTLLPSSLSPNSTANCNRMPVIPTGADRSTPIVPLKSRSPSAVTVPERIGIPSAVATALSVTPEHATSASSSMSPEHSSPDIEASSPPAFWCRPAMREASFAAAPVDSLQVMEVESSEPVDFRVTTAEEGSFR